MAANRRPGRPRTRPEVETTGTSVGKSDLNKGPKDLSVEVIISAPWGDHTLSFAMKNPSGNIPKPKQNEKAFHRAILEGLRKEFGGNVQ